MKIAKQRVQFGNVKFEAGEEVSYEIKENNKHVLIAKAGEKPNVLTHIEVFNDYFKTKEGN